MPDANASLSEGRGTVVLKCSGGLANSGQLELEEYASSLNGWQSFFELTGDLYLQSFPELQGLDRKARLSITVNAERRGSWETVFEFVLLAAAAGVIGNRVDATAVWSFHRLMRWYRLLISRHMTVRKTTSNIEELAAALEQLATQENISLELPKSESVQDDQMVLPRVYVEDDGAVEEEVVENRARALAEKIDHALISGTRPLVFSCTQISLVPLDDQPLFQMSRSDRQSVFSPLSLPLPSGDWKAGSIQFERINRKTGRALIYFINEVNSLRTGPFYSRIVDKAVHDPDNIYTRAFNADAILSVWMRQKRAEPGRLNLLWEITAKPPASTLFDG